MDVSPISAAKIAPAVTSPPPLVHFGRAADSLPLTNAVMTQAAQTFFNQPLTANAATAPQMKSMMDDLGKLGITSDMLNKLDFGAILKLLATGDTGAILILVSKYKTMIVDGIMSASDLNPLNAKRTPEQREQQRKQLDVKLTGGIAVIQIGLMLETGNVLGALKCAYDNRAALYELAKEGVNNSIPMMLYKYFLQPKPTNDKPENAVTGANAIAQPVSLMGQQINPIANFMLSQSPLLAFAKSTFDQAKACIANASSTRFELAA